MKRLKEGMSWDFIGSYRWGFSRLWHLSIIEGARAGCRGCRPREQAVQRPGWEGSCRGTAEGMSRSLGVQRDQG